MARRLSANETYNKSFEDKAPFLNKLPNATSVSTVAAFAIMPAVALIGKTCAYSTI